MWFDAGWNFLHDRGWRPRLDVIQSSGKCYGSLPELCGRIDGRDGHIRMLYGCVGAGCNQFFDTERKILSASWWCWWKSGLNFQLNIHLSFQSLQSEWKIVFYITVLAHIIQIFVYSFWGSAKIQPFNSPEGNAIEMQKPNTASEQKTTSRAWKTQRNSHFKFSL